MSIGQEIKAVCFDLDHTLGQFPTLLEDLPDEDAVPKGSYSSTLREGVPPLLEWTQRQGFLNFLTTTRSLAKASEVLKRTEIADYFEAIYEGAQIDVAFGKQYLPIAERMGFSPQEAQKRMVAVGDLRSDQPVDLEIVFICQPGGFQYNTESLQVTIETLLTLGNKDLYRGFQRWLRGDTTSVKDKLERLLQDAQPYVEYRYVDNYNISQRKYYQNEVPTIFLLPKGVQRIKR